MRVRFPSLVPCFCSSVVEQRREVPCLRGFDSHWEHHLYASIAQRIEQEFPKLCVAGLSPARGTIRVSCYRLHTCLGRRRNRFESCHTDHLISGCIAQLVEATCSKHVTCRFESYCAHHRGVAGTVDAMVLETIEETRAGSTPVSPTI